MKVVSAVSIDKVVSVEMLRFGWVWLPQRGHGASDDKWASAIIQIDEVLMIRPANARRLAKGTENLEKAWSSLKE